MIFLIAQILSIIAGICMILSLAKEDSAEEQKLQTIDCIANALADILLGGWTGAVLCLAGIVRNMWSEIEDRLKIEINPLLVNGCVWVIALAVGILTKDFFIIVLFEIGYTITLGKITKSQSRMLLAVNLLCWFIYDITILSLGMAAVDIFVFGRAVWCIYTNAPEENIVKMSIKGGSTGGDSSDLSGLLKQAADSLTAKKSGDKVDEELPDGSIDFSIASQESEESAEQSEQGEHGEHGEQGEHSAQGEHGDTKQEPVKTKPQEQKQSVHRADSPGKFTIHSKGEEPPIKPAKPLDKSDGKNAGIDPIGMSATEIPTDLQSEFESFCVKELADNATRGGSVK